jgi:hypothetical protein
MSMIFSRPDSTDHFNNDTKHRKAANRTHSGLEQGFYVKVDAFTVLNRFSDINSVSKICVEFFIR